MVKNKKIGTVLSRNAMKRLQGGAFAAPGGRCLPYLARCGRKDTCCPTSDGFAVLCGATAGNTFTTCSLVTG
jgi:hypothetical protein